jgi:hypothetical protein
MTLPKKQRRKENRTDLIRSINTPLGFYVLALLILESILGFFTYSKLTEDHVWEGFVCMLVAFVFIVSIVTFLVVFSPTKLLYGKEEHSIPALDPQALHDAVEELIARNVKPESLKTPPV